MRVLCVLSLISTVWTGYLVFGTPAGANLLIHAALILSTILFLIAVVTLVAQSASRQIEQSSDHILKNRPKHREHD